MPFKVLGEKLKNMQPIQEKKKKKEKQEYLKISELYFQ